MRGVPGDIKTHSGPPLYIRHRRHVTIAALHIPESPSVAARPGPEPCEASPADPNRMHGDDEDGVVRVRAAAGGEVPGTHGGVRVERGGGGAGGARATGEGGGRRAPGRVDRHPVDGAGPPGGPHRPRRPDQPRARPHARRARLPRREPGRLNLTRRRREPAAALCVSAPLLETLLLDQASSDSELIPFPTRPYSFAWSAISQKLRCVSDSMRSSDCPVSRAKIRLMRSRIRMISRASISTSAAVPLPPPAGWCSRKRVLGRAKRSSSGTAT